MKLFVSELYDCNEGETYLMGVFSKSVEAIHVAMKYIDGQGDDSRYTDWDCNTLTETFYFPAYTLTVTECELDEPT